MRPDMGYGIGALQLLGNGLRNLAADSGILELGAQDINPNVERSSLLDCAVAIHRGDQVAAEEAVSRYDPSKSFPVSELFRGSPYRYRCLDLFPGDSTIVADLNIFSVPAAERGTFDLITNFGTTEHV